MDKSLDIKNMDKSLDSDKINEEITDINTDIDIKQLINKLETIGNEKEKESFIKNYSKIMEEIKIVDEILETDSTPEYELDSINELFKKLEQFENKILYSDSLSIKELKLLLNICNVLEKKINDDTMSVIEIK